MIMTRYKDVYNSDLKNVRQDISNCYWITSSFVEKEIILVALVIQNFIVYYTHMTCIIENVIYNMYSLLVQNNNMTFLFILLWLI